MIEQVLVFPKELIEIYDFSKGVITNQKLLDDIEHSILDSGQLFYMNRDKAEKDPNFKQLIPYTIIQNKAGIFAYKRTKKGGESRLHDLWSIGVGGHINPIDGDSNSKVSYWEGFRRELDEEVGLKITGEPALEAVIYDDSNDVGKVHFGMVHKVVVPLDWRLETKNYALSLGGFESLATLIRLKDSFENWSKLLIENLWI